MVSVPKTKIWNNAEVSEIHPQGINPLKRVNYQCTKRHNTLEMWPD